MMGVVFDLDNQGFVLEYVKYGALAHFVKRVTDEDGLFKPNKFIVLVLAVRLLLLYRYPHTTTCGRAVQCVGVLGFLRQVVGSNLSHG